MAACNIAARVVVNQPIVAPLSSVVTNLQDVNHVDRPPIEMGGY